MSREVTVYQYLSIYLSSLQRGTDLPAPLCGKEEWALMSVRKPVQYAETNLKQLLILPSPHDGQRTLTAGLGQPARCAPNIFAFNL